MSPVELSHTLVSRLGVLESHVLDPNVTELLVAGPNSVWLTRDGRTEKLELRFDEGAIRSLASRLTRTLAWKDSRITRTGLIAPELHVSIVGTPRGERCPVIRFVRRSTPKRTLSQLAENGMLDRDAELRLLDACRARRSIVISGHPGSGRTDLLAALARVWKEERRVAVLDEADGRLSVADIGHVTLEPTAGAEGAALIGAEVIVTDDPRSSLWAQLLGHGRPFIATLEASDAQGALDRMVAFCLQERADTSPVAGMALVESTIGLVVDMERTNGRARVRSIAEPQRANGHLSARVLMRPNAEGAAPALSRLPDLHSVVALPKETSSGNFVVDGFGFETSDLSEIRAESLMTSSFVGQLPNVAFDAPAETKPPASKPFDDGTKEITPPDEVKALRRGASERTPTLIGREEGAVEREDETQLPPDEMTMHAEAAEMTLEPVDDASFDERSHTSPSSKDDDDESWHEAPSEVMESSSLQDDADETESKEFHNERTPYSSFEQKSDPGDPGERLTHEEIEGMLSELDDVVDIGDDDDGPKAKRRTRRAR